MSNPSVAVARGVLGFGLLLLAHAASAQDAGISGVVTDNTGGVLPGVTVTAASPALIEQQRIAVTDGEGRYTITQLRSGTYSVTFTLPGFNTVVREGIALTAGFTAAIDAQLVVGGIEETITVTGATPIVDVQNVRRQQVVTAERLEALPMSTKHVNNLVTLTAGFTGLADVGGRYTSQVGGTFHGKNGTKVSMDGMGVENSSGNSSYQINSASVQEMVMQTSGISADTNADGAVVNVVPKEGSNTFSGILSGFFANDKMEGQNVTAELEERGIESSNRTLKLWDESLSLGGPIVRDRLWYFVAGRSWGFSRRQAGVYWNQSTYPGAPPTGLSTYLTPPDAQYKVVRFVPWVDQPDDRFNGRLEWYDSYLTRITWQATPRNKVNFTYDEQRACNCGSTNANSQQEESNGYRFDPNRLVQFSWTSTLTSRLLLEAGSTTAISQWNEFWAPGVTPDVIAITDQGLGYGYGADEEYRGDPNNTDRHSQRFSLAYVTGSHNFKAGVQTEFLVDNIYTHVHGNREYRFRNGVPNQVTQHITPYLLRTRALDMGIYAQDQWTIDRLTLNLGVRFDSLNGWVPVQTTPDQPTAGAWPGALRVNEWIPPQTYDEVKDVPNWKDINPRVGVAYDLFGNGRTAVKASLGRYVAKIGNEITLENNPIETSVAEADRSWNDANGNYIPDCDLGNFDANGECGAIDNNNFGQQNPDAVRWDDAILTGLRDSNWDLSLELQQELFQGLSVTTGYYWNNAGYNQQTNSKNRVTDNLLLSASDFDEYCVTAPSDSRLPNGGGYEICGLYDVKPDKFGQAALVITDASQFGDVLFRNHFFNVTVDARLPNGINFGGGFDTGRSIQDRCFVVDSPQELLNCRVVTPFKGQTQVKLYGSVPFPGDVMVSATYQDLSGENIQANYAATNAEIAGSLGRDLAGGRRTATVPLVEPQTLFDERVRRLDLRLSKVINYDRFRFQINFDAYNVLNAASVRGVNSTYGPRWQYPTTIMDPRLFEIGGQINF